MIRKDGYLDLDLYYKELKEKNNLTNKDLYDKGLIKTTDYSKWHFWLTIEGESYYFKTSSFKPMNELICYELATLMGIEATPYDLAIYRDNFGVISKNYKKDNCKYISGSDILKEYYENNLNTLIDMGFDKEKDLSEDIPYHVQMNNLEIIWQALEYKYPNYDISKCMHKLVLHFIFCMITGQIDKASHNWEIEEHDGYIDLVSLYDNSLSFYKLDENGEMFVSFNNIDESMKTVLEEFLRVSSKEFVDLFLEKFNLLTEEVLLNVFLKIEEKIGCSISNSIKSEMLYTLNYNRNEINDVLNKLNIENKNGRK